MQSTPQESVHRICRLDELADPGCREFRVGGGDWPFSGFVVRRGDRVLAYRNRCKHLGHPLNWKPDEFLTRDRGHIICASHGAVYEIASGLCIAGPCTGKALDALEVSLRAGAVFVRCPERA